MNSTSFFSLNRLGLLLRNDLLINYKKYIFTILGAFIVGYVILYLNMPKKEYLTDQEITSYWFNSNRYVMIFMMYLFALGAFVGIAFPMMSSKVKTSSYLLTPASTFEKYLSQFLIHVVGGIVFFILLFWLDAHLARASALAVFEGDSTWAIAPFSYSGLWATISGEDNALEVTLISFIVSIGFFLFSARLFFRKNGLVKSVILMATLIFIGVCLVVISSHIFFPASTTGFEVRIPDYQFDFMLLGKSRWSNIELTLTTLGVFSWLFFLPLGYFKLKEKEL